MLGSAKRLEIQENEDAEDGMFQKSHSMFSCRYDLGNHHTHVKWVPEKESETACAADRCREEWSLLPMHPGYRAITSHFRMCLEHFSGTCLDTELLIRR